MIYLLSLTIRFTFLCHFLDHSLRRWGRSLWLYCNVYFLLSNLYVFLLTKILLALFLTIRTASLSAYVLLLFISLFVHVVGHSTLGLHPVHLESELVSMQVSVSVQANHCHNHRNLLFVIMRLLAPLPILLI